MISSRSYREDTVHSSIADVKVIKSAFKLHETDYDIVSLEFLVLFETTGFKQRFDLLFCFIAHIPIARVMNLVFDKVAISVTFPRTSRNDSVHVISLL